MFFSCNKWPTERQFYVNNVIAFGNPRYRFASGTTNAAHANNAGHANNYLYEFGVQLNNQQKTKMNKNTNRINELESAVRALERANKKLVRERDGLLAAAEAAACYLINLMGEFSLDARGCHVLDDVLNPAINKVDGTAR